MKKYSFYISDPSLLVGVVVSEEPCSFSPPLVTQLIKRNQIPYQGELDEHELDEQEKEDDDNNDDDDNIFPSNRLVLVHHQLPRPASSYCS